VPSCFTSCNSHESSDQILQPFHHYINAIALVLYPTFQHFNFIKKVMQHISVCLCFCSLPSTQRRSLHDKRLHVVTHQWLDDSLEKGKKLLEDAYNLKPDTLEDLKIEER